MRRMVQDLTAAKGTRATKIKEKDLDRTTDAETASVGDARCLLAPRMKARFQGCRP